MSGCNRSEWSREKVEGFNEGLREAAQVVKERTDRDQADIRLYYFGQGLRSEILRQGLPLPPYNVPPNTDELGRADDALLNKACETVLLRAEVARLTTKLESAQAFVSSFQSDREHLRFKIEQLIGNIHNISSIAHDMKHVLGAR